MKQNKGFTQHLCTGAGFTLIEMLIGITVLMLIITAVYASYSAGMKAYKKIDNETYLNQNIRQSWRILSRDLRCAFMSASNNKNIKFTGETNKVTFTTYSCDIYPKPVGLSEVSYYIINDTKDSFEGLVKETGSKLHEIAPLAKSLKLRYYDGKEWKDTWGIDDSKQIIAQANILPLAVEVTVKIIDENGSERTISTSVPIMSN